jgi:hypothetical protein
MQKVGALKPPGKATAVSETQLASGSKTVCVIVPPAGKGKAGRPSTVREPPVTCVSA